MFKYKYIGQQPIIKKHSSISIEERAEIERIRDVYLNDKTQITKQKKYIKVKPTSKK